MKTRVRQLTPGLDRTRHAAIRAVLLMIAAASISGVLLGPAAAAAVASGSDGRGAAHSGADDSGERDEACDRDRVARAENPHDHIARPEKRHDDVERHAGDDDRRRNCNSFPPSRAHAPATPQGQGPPPPAIPEQASTTAVTPSKPIVTLRRPMVVTPRVPLTPIGQAPPLLAPPDLTVPVPRVAGAVSTSPVSIYVITLSTLVLATVIAIAALVLVRRSD